MTRAEATATKAPGAKGSGPASADGIGRSDRQSEKRRETGPPHGAALFLCAFRTAGHSGQSHRRTPVHCPSPPALWWPWPPRGSCSDPLHAGHLFTQRFVRISAGESQSAPVSSCVPWNVLLFFDGSILPKSHISCALTNGLLPPGIKKRSSHELRFFMLFFSTVCFMAHRWEAPGRRRSAHRRRPGPTAAPPRSGARLG